MIDATTRARWRTVFAQRTVGPWAQDPPGGTLVVVPQYAKRTVAVTTTEADAAFLAQAWEGWPAALDELEQAEKERDEAKVAAERIQNGADADDAERIEDSIRWANEVNALTRKVAKLEDACTITRNSAEFRGAKLAKAEPLIDALKTWAKDRHTPKLLAALAAYEAP